MNLLKFIFDKVYKNFGAVITWLNYYDLKVERSDEIYYVNFISDGGETKYLLEKESNQNIQKQTTF